MDKHTLEEALRKEEIKYRFMWLRVKIFIGYTALISLLVLTVILFRGERMKLHVIRQQEQEQLRICHRTEQVYADLLELATLGETVSVWDTADFQAYRSRQEAVCRSLRLLKLSSPGQQSRLDSLCLLLGQKETLLGAVMKTFHHIYRMDEIVSRQIPAIVSSVCRSDPPSSVRPAEEEKSPESSEAGGNFFSKLFKRKEKKSAYLEQREKNRKAEAETSQRLYARTATNMLHSLDKEVSEHHEAGQEKLLHQMDSLYTSNMELNRRLYRIVRDFESDADRLSEEHYLRFIRESDRSFHRIFILAVSISLLAIILYIIIHRDLKRKYKYQHELERSDEANRRLLQSRKDMMLAIAHDLRSPLATISGSADLLPGEDDGWRKTMYVENIRHASEYMLSLVNTLMDFYLLDTGQIQAYTCIFHLESLLRETADSHLPSAQRKGLCLSCSFSGTDVVVCADKGHLRQIADNLLSNAVKFTEKGSIRLEAEYRNRELRFSVRDTGTGIDESETGRIFTAFERLENARGISGSGLGLAICSRLASQTGGFIRVESRKGEGSCFTVLLPLAPADGASPMEEDHPAFGSPLEGIRILVLDDDIRQLGIIREMLRRHHAVCDCCTDSSGIISRLRENGYDVLLTDIQMLETDGFAVLELLRSSNIPQAGSIPAIALTARMDDDKEYLSRGFAGCIRKPFTMESLAEGVAGVVGKMKGGERRPDFSLILAGEDNRREMLEVFITESRKDLSRLHKALEKDDRPAVCDILHKNLPLWDAVRLDFPIEELKRLITTPPDLWTVEDLARIHEIEKAADRLLSYAINMKKEKE